MIKQLREKTGMSQAEAAKKLKINTGFWCRVESGDVGLPPKHFKKVATMLKVPLTSLINFQIKHLATALRDKVDRKLAVRCDLKIGASAGTH